MNTLEIIVILQFAALVFVSAIAVKLNANCAARERQIDELRAGIPR